MTFERNKNNTETSKKNQIYDKNKKNSGYQMFNQILLKTAMVKGKSYWYINDRIYSTGLVYKQYVHAKNMICCPICF